MSYALKIENPKDEKSSVMAEEVIEKRKNTEKKLAQVTIFQVICILSLPTYAQIAQKISPQMIVTWTGFLGIVGLVIATTIYKKSIRKNLEDGGPGN